MFQNSIEKSRKLPEIAVGQVRYVDARYVSQIAEQGKLGAAVSGLSSRG